MLSQLLHQSDSWTSFYVEKRHRYTTMSLRNIHMAHINTSSQETLIFILSCLFENHFASNYKSLFVHLKLLKPVFRCVHHKLHGGLHVAGRTWRQTGKENPVGRIEGNWETLPFLYPVVPFNPSSSIPIPLYLQFPNRAKSIRRIPGLCAI